MNDLKHVTEWCEAYSEKTKLKIFPQSAPVLAIIEDLLSVIAKHQLALVEMSRAMMDMNAQIGNVIELTKPTAKVDKKEVKK